MLRLVDVMGVRAIRSFLPRSRKNPALRVYTTTPLIRMPKVLYAELKAHALENAPDECCGILAMRCSDVIQVLRAKNIAEDPEADFMVDPTDQRSIMDYVLDMGLRVGAIYHSHPMADAFPSAKDISLAYPDYNVLHVIIGMGEGLVARAWSIEGCRVREARLEIT